MYFDYRLLCKSLDGTDFRSKDDYMFHIRICCVYFAVVCQKSVSAVRKAFFYFLPDNPKWVLYCEEDPESYGRGISSTDRVSWNSIEGVSVLSRQ